MNGDTSRTDWSFYIDEQGMSYFLLDKNQKHAVGTYDYDPDTGIYTFDYFREDLMGIDHIIEEGYFIDEDCRIVLIKIAMVEGDIVHVLSELKTEYIRVSE